MLATSRVGVCALGWFLSVQLGVDPYIHLRTTGVGDDLSTSCCGGSTFRLSHLSRRGDFRLHRRSYCRHITRRIAVYCTLHDQNWDSVTAVMSGCSDRPTKASECERVNSGRFYVTCQPRRLLRAISAHSNSSPLLSTATPTDSKG